MEYTSIFLYPWDIADEGIDHVLEMVKERIGVNSISLTVSYHAGKFLLPHNPRRKVYFPEDGALYFQPRVNAFSDSEIKPRIAGLIKEKNLLPAVIEKARRYGLKITGWMVCLHNTYLGSLYPQYATQNAYGDRYYFSLCPSQEDVRKYVSSVLAELVRDHSLDAVELESPGFMGFTHGFHHEIQGIEIDGWSELLLSICFCEACKRLGFENKINANQVQANVRAALDRFFEAPWGASASPVEAMDRVPGLKDYLLLRNETVTRLFSRLQEIVEKTRSHLIFVTLPDIVSWTSGTDLTRIGKIISAVEIACYARRKEEIAVSMSTIRESLPRRTKLYAAFRPSFPDCDSADELREKIAACRRIGVVGCSFYNYGLVREAEFEWIKQAVLNNKD